MRWLLLSDQLDGLGEFATVNVELAGKLAEIGDDLGGDIAETGDIPLHAAGGFAGRLRNLGHGADEFGHAQHQRVFERAHVLVRAAQHFLQHDVGFAQPLEQSGGVGAQHRVRFQHLLDGRRRGFFRLVRSPFA